MGIVVNLDVMLAKRKMSVTELAEKVGITMANISILKNGKAKAIRFSTLEKICEVLECQPGDLLIYEKCKNCGDAAFLVQVVVHVFIFATENFKSDRATSVLST